MFKALENIIKNLEGNVLTVCIDDELINKFSKNNLVELYAINSCHSKENKIKFKKNIKLNNKGKKINIKKIRRYINKKTVNHLICNMNEMFPYYKYFIRDSIYLNNNLLYIYASSNIDKEFLINKYKRYNVKISCKDYKNGFILIIDNSKSKNNIIKDKIYFIKDTLYNIAEAIGNIMIS